MQVACGHCGAKYEFDAAAIPADGYDAQCTGCGHVFFVAPESPASAPAPEPVAKAAAEPTPPAADELITVSCGSCGAQYQFASSAIPIEGYDAQCTQCQAVFFVSPEGDNSSKSEPAADGVARLSGTEPVLLDSPKSPPVAAAPLPEEPKQTAAARVIEPAEPAPASTPAESPHSPEAVPDGVDGGSGDAYDMMAMAADLGTADPHPDGVLAEDDFESIIARRRKVRLMALGSVGALGAVALVLYLLLPTVFDATIGPLIGVKAGIHPDAVPHVNKAIELMLDDTDEAYQAAIGEFDKALAIDALYPDAIALRGMAHVFRGADIQEQGRLIYDEGAKALAEIKALSDLPKHKRPPNAAAREKELRETAKNSNEASGKKFEEGGKLLTTGLTVLKAALKEYREEPIIAEAAGVYYATDSDGIAKASQLLQFSLRLRLGPDATLDLNSPPDQWLPYLQGRVQVASNAEDQAPGSFEAALRHEERFQRARFRLAQLHLQRGKQEEGRKLAKHILSAVPSHSKAKALLAIASNESANKGSAGVTAAPAKGKRRRGKRRR